jgi:hypothetical protein
MYGAGRSEKQRASYSLIVGEKAFVVGERFSEEFTEVRTDTRDEYDADEHRRQRPIHHAISRCWLSKKSVSDRSSGMERAFQTK